MYTTVKRIRVENDQTIHPDAYADFYHDFQLGVLLSLKEEGKLTQMQYRIAEEALKEQRRAAMRAKGEAGGRL